MIYTHGVSDEPLEIIRLNECEADEGLCTSRFRRLWNEIADLRRRLLRINAINDDPSRFNVEIDELSNIALERVADTTAGGREP